MFSNLATNNLSEWKSRMMMGVDFEVIMAPTQKRFHFICIFTDDGIILRFTQQGKRCAIFSFLIKTDNFVFELEDRVTLAVLTTTEATLCKISQAVTSFKVIIIIGLV